MRFNGAGVYFLYDMLLHFFGKTELHNKRLEAVHWDLNVLAYRVGCRALGLIGNKNTLTGLTNCKNTSRHHAHLSICAKSRKTNRAKLWKWPKNLNLGNFLTISKPNISKSQKNRFHSNWRSYLVLTSGWKPKKSLEPFLRKISVSDLG